MHGDALTHREVVDVGADLGDGAAEFVAKGNRNGFLREEMGIPNVTTRSVRRRDASKAPGSDPLLCRSTRVKYLIDSLK